MARVVEGDLSDEPRAGRPPKYPWEEWFDGKRRILVQGEDYDADSPKSFRSTVYSAATRLNVEVATKIIKGELHVQAVTPVKKANGTKSVRRKRSSD